VLCKLASFLKAEFKSYTSVTQPDADLPELVRGEIESQVGGPSSEDVGSHKPGLVKAPRLINARGDEAKLAFGAIGHAADKVIFANKHFIKNTPWKDRIQKIKDRLVAAGRVYHNLDYESFECSFGKEWIQKIEVYFMERLADSCAEFQDLVQQILGPVLSGIQKIRNLLYRCIIEATRMSGEMFTSCFNGLANYLLVTWLYKGYLEDFFLEGDDNILAATADPGRVVDRAADLGFVLKLTRLDYPGAASFCGLLFCEDSPDGIRDAAHVLAKFGWTKPQYHGCGAKLKRRLIRAKALSIGYENGRCPILWKLAQHYMHLTQNVKLGKLGEKKGLFDQYQRHRLQEAIEFGPDIGEPTLETRLFYERTFGMTVQHQIKVEEEIEACGTGPMALPSMIFPPQYVWMYHAYVAYTNLAFASILWAAGGGGTTDDVFAEPVST
jgi:hypothetical protein